LRGHRAADRAAYGPRGGWCLNFINQHIVPGSFRYGKGKHDGERLLLDPNLVNENRAIFPSPRGEGAAQRRMRGIPGRSKRKTLIRPSATFCRVRRETGEAIGEEFAGLAVVSGRAIPHNASLQVSHPLSAYPFRSGSPHDLPSTRSDPPGLHDARIR
jgi:hypothetical protein